MGGVSDVIESKPWGSVEHLVGPVAARVVDQDAVVDKMQLMPGGYSSLHLHKTRANLFILISGRLDVIEYVRQSTGERPGEGLTAEQLSEFLEADAKRLDAWREVGRSALSNRGDSVTVPPNKAHRFEVLEPSVLLEVYWSTTAEPVDSQDTHRFWSNGRQV